MFLPLVAVRTEFDNGRLLQEEDTIRRMRGMTGFAISFRGVLGLAVLVLGFLAGK